MFKLKRRLTKLTSKLGSTRDLNKEVDEIDNQDDSTQDEIEPKNSKKSKTNFEKTLEEGLEQNENDTGNISKKKVKKKSKQEKNQDMSHAITEASNLSEDKVISIESSANEEIKDETTETKLDPGDENDTRNKALADETTDNIEELDMATNEETHKEENADAEKGPNVPASQNDDESQNDKTAKKKDKKKRFSFFRKKSDSPKLKKKEKQKEKSSSKEEVKEEGTTSEEQVEELEELKGESESLNLKEDTKQPEEDTRAGNLTQNEHEPTGSTVIGEDKAATELIRDSCPNELESEENQNTNDKGDSASKSVENVTENDSDPPDANAEIETPPEAKDKKKKGKFKKSKEKEPDAVESLRSGESVEDLLAEGTTSKKTKKPSKKSKETSKEEGATNDDPKKEETRRKRRNSAKVYPSDFFALAVTEKEDDTDGVHDTIQPEESDFANPKENQARVITQEERRNSQEGDTQATKVDDQLVNSLQLLTLPSPPWIPNEFVDNCDEEGFINSYRLFNKLSDALSSPTKENPALLILDTRDEVAYNQRHIPTAKFAQIFINEVEGNQEESLSALTDTLIVLYDNRGLSLSLTDSMLSQAIDILGSKGLKSSILTGGCQDFMEKFPFMCSPHVGVSAEDSTSAAENDLDHPSIILIDQLYLGTGEQAKKEQIINNLAITHIVNVSIEFGNYFDSKIAYSNVPVKDEASSDLQSHFLKVIQFIHNALHHKGRVLVHCSQGTGRSAAIVIAYLMMTKKWTAADAAKYVTTRRPVISLNRVFLKQLKSFEKKLFGKNAKAAK